MDSLHYSKALVISDVPASLPPNALRLDEPSDTVNLEQARKQLRDYKNTLISLGLEVIEVECDERYPDCVFVEDTVIVCGGKALICRLGHESRRGEVDAIKHVLQSKLGTLKVVEMKDPAAVDGGDVLFTGKEFFVGISSRTNMEGMKFLAETFSDFPVSAINVLGGLHLKSMMTLLGEDTIIISNDKAGRDAWEEIKSKGKYEYKRVEVPDVHSTNVLYINGTVVHPPTSCPASLKALDSNPSPKIVVDATEFRKVDGCLTCLSVLM